MTKYTAIFKDGTELVRTEKEFKNRVDFYNWICMNRLGKKYGRLVEIRCSVIPA
nr:MAG TPA: hypothetical protein [Caudoviricetes sp.]